MLTIPKHWQSLHTYTHRYSLPHSGTPFTGSAAIDEQTKQRILDIDPTLELIEVVDKVVLYRVKRYGATSGDDYLVKQFILDNPPGEWLVTTLKRGDTWKQFGKKNHVENFLKYADEIEEKFAIEKEVRRMEHIEEVAANMLKYGKYGCKHVLMNRVNHRKNKRVGI